jgi:hypothetical protein
MLKSSIASQDDVVFAGEPSYLPPSASVVAPSVLAEVFEDGQLPFATNVDGSVDWTVYQTWLRETWAGGMAQFDDQSEAVPTLRLQDRPAA